MPKHKSWLDFADYDLKASKILINSKEPLIPPALVLAQQSIEKAIKGYLFYKNHVPIKNHDLVMLIKICTKYDEEFKSIIEDCAELNPHISVSRYPDSVFLIPDLTTAKILVNKAECILNFINNKIY